jgi:succinate dehydrogenase/fumarate reductase iron-sulfur protein
MADTVEITIVRSDPGARSRFTVAAHAQQTVLDALFTIQGDDDPTLAFRCACRVGMCGSCGMVINGREGLACRTAVRPLGSRVHLAPMRHQAVVRDLVVDMASFFDAYAAVRPYLSPRPDVRDPVVARPGSGIREDIDLGLECINCGLCYSACDMVGLTGGRFLGPAALNRAYNLVADVRDGLADRRLDAVTRDLTGVWSCHTHMSCVEVCPKGIEPTRAIGRLKRRAALRALAGRRPRPDVEQYRWEGGAARGGEAGERPAAGRASCRP